MVLIVAVAAVANAAVLEAAEAVLATDKGTLSETLYTLPLIRK